MEATAAWLDAESFLLLTHQFFGLLI